MTRHSREILDQMLDHLHYEIDMINKTSVLIRSMGDDESDTFRNAVLESFLVHVRILLEFLFHSDNHPDEVRADDYVPDWIQHRNFSKDTKRFFAKLQRAVNARVSHLSIRRLTPEESDIEWGDAQIVNELSHALQRFHDLRR
jgi:hypothetical protein